MSQETSGNIDKCEQFCDHLLNFVLDGKIGAEGARELLTQQSLCEKAVCDAREHGQKGWLIAVTGRVFRSDSLAQAIALAKEAAPGRLWFAGLAAMQDGPKPAPPPAPVAPPAPPPAPPPQPQPITVTMDPSGHFRLPMIWTVGGVAHAKDFVIDPGSPISSVDIDNAKGCTVEGGIGLGGVLGGGTVVVVSGGTMEVSFPPPPGSPPGTPPTKRTCNLPVSIIPVHLLGNDQLKELKLKLAFDYSVTPPTCTLTPG